MGKTLEVEDSPGMVCPTFSTTFQCYCDPNLNVLQEVTAAARRGQESVFRQPLGLV